MTRLTLALLPFLLAAVAQAEPCELTGQTTEPIPEAKLFIENNAGDGDMGVHGQFDSHGWQELCLFDPAGDMIVHVSPERSFRDLGLSGVFWESVEPVYGDWGYDDLKTDFPEGEYGVRAVGLDGTMQVGTARFTTVVPSMPVITAPTTVPDAMSPGMPMIPVSDMEVTWLPVTTSVDGRPVDIVAFQLTVVKENHTDPDATSRPAFSVHLSGDATGFTVPASFFDTNSLYELEVLAIERSGNRTIGGASFFRTE
ncbi:hypothetical protein DEA8626_03609 [Defluviimonas aquaemixtae]|uniref:Fibronectin type-III domain-containing protein n=1 Tax=Albidovulum aquaemixtae TaxID=1542388 RepID=A0A2R8BMA6_9RHOB|nr:hypothetical protein [Defluviimonas aquaemixtae]SPH24557.1 hypothetical protein DEA8626_03609 [Defluviimonas aquaemixtae]